jgi:TatD DNase family protein
VIDTHAHLDACDGPGSVLERAREAGVTAVVTIGTGIESCRAALALADRHPDVFCALGLDPYVAGTPGAARLDELRELLAHPRVVALGEIGLDGYRAPAPLQLQRPLFEAQLELASALRLPVVIHSRAAGAETLQALESFAGTVVLHCFSEPELLPAASARGYYVSFAGNLTYP